MSNVIASSVGVSQADRPYQSSRTQLLRSSDKKVLSSKPHESVESLRPSVSFPPLSKFSSALLRVLVRRQGTNWLCREARQLSLPLQAGPPQAQLAHFTLLRVELNNESSQSHANGDRTHQQLIGDSLAPALFALVPMHSTNLISKPEEF